MNAVKNSFSKRFNKFRLFLGDIEAIAEVFAQAGYSVDIQADGYQLDTLAELSKLENDRLDSLKIQSTHSLSNIVSFEYEKGSIWLYIQEDSITNRGVFEKIAAIINRRRTIWRKLFYNTYLPSMLLGVVSGVLIGSRGKGYATETRFIILMVVITIGLLLYTTLMLITVLKRSGTIYKKSKKEISSFWIRQKDNIVSNLIAALMGSILTLVAQYIFRR